MSHVAKMSKPSIIFPFLYFLFPHLEEPGFVLPSAIVFKLGAKVLYLATLVKIEKGLGEGGKDVCGFYVSHSQMMTVALGDCKDLFPCYPSSN